MIDNHFDYNIENTYTQEENFMENKVSLHHIVNEIELNKKL